MSAKRDVYSFGVLVLEVLSGRSVSEGARALRALCLPPSDLECGCLVDPRRALIAAFRSGAAVLL